MDCQMPLAAALAALLVPSDRCADASYPVIVYWVRIAAIGSTKSRKPQPEVAPPNMPLLLIVLANTSPKLACCSGMAHRITITAAAPATCHHTETLLMTAKRCEEKMLMSAEIAKMTTNSTKVRFRL